MSESWSIGSILDWTSGYFDRHNIPEARLEAEVLLSSVLKCPRLNLYIKKDEVVPEEKLKTYRNFISERQKRKPLSYILGEKEFRGLRFKVNQHTLIPRPETELLVEEVLKLLEGRSRGIVLDIGTGSGNISVCVGRSPLVSRIYAADISLEALSVAQENIDFHGLAGKIIPKRGNIFEAVADENLDRAIDVIVSNPPYIAQDELDQLAPELSYEPRQALDGGKDGLDYYRAIAEGSKRYLKNEGYLVFEMSAHKSAQIQEILEAHAYSIKNVIKDYAGLERIVVAQ
jgi:release factor glutamine methyltransferase